MNSAMQYVAIKQGRPKCGKDVRSMLVLALYAHVHTRLGYLEEPPWLHNSRRFLVTKSRFTGFLLVTPVCLPAYLLDISITYSIHLDKVIALDKQELIICKILLHSRVDNILTQGHV